MRAAYAARFNDADPLAALEIGDMPEPEPRDGWEIIDVRAASLNHHDLWSLRGVGLREEQLPMILGCDAAGVDAKGRDVVVYPVVSKPGAGTGTEALARASILSEKYPGTLAERVAVPRGNVVVKPAELSYAEAACMPTAWLTAYRMLVTKGQVRKGSTVLVQGAGGGVATAAVLIAHALGASVYATSRSAAKRARIAELGATALETGARLPERVDVVIETVGEATFEHSLKSLKPGGRLVVSGATSGPLPRLDLRRVFFHHLSVLGTSMGTPDELCDLLQLCVDTGLRPIVDQQYSFDDVREAFAHLARGDIFGKLVIADL